MNYKSADKWTNEEIRELSVTLSHSSCAIEGNKLSLDEVRKLLSDNDDYGDLLVLYNKILKYHNDIVEFIYEEMDGKLYCDRLFINDLLEKEVILPNSTRNNGNIVENEQLVVILKKYLDDVKLIIDKIKNVKDKINNSVALKLNLSDKLNELLNNYPSLIAEIDTFTFKDNSVSEYTISQKYVDLFDKNTHAINLLNAQSDLANLVLFEMKLDENQKQELIKDIKNITVYENDESFGLDVKAKMQEFLNKQNVDEPKDTPEDKNPEEASPEKDNDSTNDKDSNKQDDNKVMIEELKQSIVEFKSRIDKYIKDPKLLSYYSERLEKLTSKEEFNLLLSEYENDVKEGKISEKSRWYDNTGALGSLIAFGVFSVAALILSGVILIIKKVKSKKQ